MSTTTRNCIVHEKDFCSLPFPLPFVVVSHSRLATSHIILKINKSSHQILLLFLPLYCSMHHYVSSAASARAKYFIEWFSDICHGYIFFRWHLLWREQNLIFRKRRKKSWKCLFRLKREVSIGLSGWRMRGGSLQKLTDWIKMSRKLMRKVKKRILSKFLKDLWWN